MTKSQDDEPLFITDEIEAEMTAAGYVFEPPVHVSTQRLRDVVAALSDGELATWPGRLTKQELERRQFNRSPDP